MAKLKQISDDKDIERFYDNVENGMIVTTVHKGSGHVNTLYVPGQFCDECVDEEEKPTGEKEIVGGLKHLQNKSRIAHAEFLKTPEGKEWLKKQK